MTRAVTTSPAGRLKKIFGALALLGVVAWAPLTHANSGADATILNVVTVTYSDAGGTQNFSATASATVTINLVEAAVTLSGRPDGTDAGDTKAVPVEASTSSGSTQTYLYAVTANANGDDIYDLTLAKDATANVTADTVTSNLVQPDGTTVITANPTQVTLGASVITAVPAVNQLQFPAGTLDNIAVNDIVVINGVDYAVSVVSNGTAASHTNGSGPNTTLGTTTAETPASLTLIANANGSNTAPALTSARIGEVAAEQVLLQVNVTATANVPGSDGTVDFDLTIEPDGTTGSNTASVVDHTTTFTAASLTITKEVRNQTNSGAFGASGTGDPGDVLEYRLTITNGGGDATLVVVTDPIPAYTTLVTHSAGYGSGGGTGVGANVFAQAELNLGSTTAITVQSSDNEGATVASGDAAGTTAGDDLTFYVGNGNTSSAGGTVTSADSFTIIYQVQID